MRYMENISIDTFKGIEELTLTNLEDINILVGDNNTCKTSVLEAVQLFQYPYSVREIMRIARKRDINKRLPSGLSAVDSFLNMFNASQEEKKCLLVNCTMNHKQQTLGIKGTVGEVYISEEEIEQINLFHMDEDVPISEFKGSIIYNDTMKNVCINEVDNEYRNVSLASESREKQLINIKYVSSSDHLNENYSVRLLANTIKNDEKSRLLELLRKFDNNIEGIEMLPNKNLRRTTTYIKHSKYGFMPLSSFGDGVKKVLTLAAALLNAAGGILLIDEIETAIHTSGLDSVFKWLIESCEMLRIQIIATTHSDEALASLLSNSNEVQLKMCVYRLEKLEGKIISRRFSAKKAYDIVVNNGGDLR